MIFPITVAKIKFHSPQIMTRSQRDIACKPDTKAVLLVQPAKGELLPIEKRAFVRQIATCQVPGAALIYSRKATASGTATSIQVTT